MPQRPRRILPLIAVALLSAAAGGWIGTAVFDGRVQVLAADMAQAVTRKLTPDWAARAHRRPLDPSRQFRVEGRGTSQSR